MGGRERNLPDAEAIEIASSGQAGSKTCSGSKGEQDDANHDQDN